MTHHPRLRYLSPDARDPVSSDSSESCNDSYDLAGAFSQEVPETYCGSWAGICTVVPPAPLLGKLGPQATQVLWMA